MKRFFAVLLVIGSGSATSAVQTPEMMAQMAANPVSQTSRMMLEEHSQNIIAAADLMPVDKYRFHPTEAQMTFGKLVAHIAQTNEFLCSAIAGSPKQEPPTTPTERDTKEVLVKAVKDSFAHCSTALQGLTDAKASEMIWVGSQEIPRVYFMFVLIADWADHYSTQASYLRLNGILPPTARQPAGR